MRAQVTGENAQMTPAMRCVELALVHSSLMGYRERRDKAATETAHCSAVSADPPGERVPESLCLLH